MVSTPRMAILASIGNMKLGKDTLILNITSATDCPSRKLGLCRISSKCYALKAERIYRHPLDFRRAQTKQWDLYSAKSLAQMIILVAQKRGVQYLRFSESGDFRSQADVNKMDELARLVKKAGLRTYGYTARQDLDFTKVKHMVVNGSSFMVHNQFTAVTDPSGSVCPLNCRYCNMCKLPLGNKIEVKYH